MKNDERGAVAILVALSLTILLIVTAMVLDFGVVRLDRQGSKSMADSAAMAGVKVGDGGQADLYTFRAVCGALEFLRTSDSKLSGLPDDICSVTNLAAKQAVKCNAADPTTFATYDRTITSLGTSYRVVIKSPYDTTDGGFAEENYSTLASDRSTVSGCDQVGVVIAGSRRPGLGSLATTGNLSFSVRSASRALIGGKNSLAPALILLERSACSVLTVGSAGGGSGTYINVKGAALPSEVPPVYTPGSIHLDSAATGADCGSGSNQQLIQGKQNNGIVAFGANDPLGAKTGLITTKATFDGKSIDVVRDNSNYVYGTDAVSGTGGSHSEVLGKDTVGRQPVDERYRTAIRSAISNANFWTSAPDPTIWTTTNCNPTAAQLLLTGKLYIDCPQSSGITLNNTTILASEIFFNGFIKGGKISMPNASRVYVNNTDGSGATVNSKAITLGNNDGFCVRSTCGSTTADACYPGGVAVKNVGLPLKPAAQLFVRQGNIDLSGGLLRLCGTTAILQGGSTTTGCVPDNDLSLPKSTPCASVGPVPAGNSRIDVTGSAQIDWSAPNEYPGTITAGDENTAWAKFEDLALWSESAGGYSFAGSGAMSTVGVFMTPNAMPFNLGGGSNQTLFNAQYVARTFAVSGGGTLNLTTDPRNAVTIKGITGYALVR